MEDPTQQQTVDSINETDVTFFQVSRCLEYLPLTLLTLYLYVCVSCIYACITHTHTHTHTHTRSLFMSRSCLYVCVIGRGGVPSLSRCVCVCGVIEEGRRVLSVLELLKAQFRTYLLHCSRTKRISRDLKLQLYQHSTTKSH